MECGGFALCRVALVEEPFVSDAYVRLKLINSDGRHVTTVSVPSDELADQVKNWLYQQAAGEVHVSWDHQASKDAASMEQQ
jgi:hypothetical protein